MSTTFRLAAVIATAATVLVAMFFTSFAQAPQVPAVPTPVSRSPAELSAGDGRTFEESRPGQLAHDPPDL